MMWTIGIIVNLLFGFLAAWNFLAVCWIRQIAKKIGRDIITPLRQVQEARPIRTTIILTGPYFRAYLRAMEDSVNPNPLYWANHWDDSYAPADISPARATEILLRSLMN